MNLLSKEWLKAAYFDLITIQYIIDDSFLTHITAFHSEQSIEKCFKALLAYNDIEIPRIHDIRRLHKIIENEIPLDEEKVNTLLKINELYIDSRYPSDLGLLPDGRPTLNDAKEFYNLAFYIFDIVCKKLAITTEDLK